MALAASSSVIVSGGEIRRTLPYKPPLPISRPRSFAPSMACAATSAPGSFVSRSFTSSTPSIRPLPRTSPTASCRSPRSRSPSIRNLPTVRALCWRSSSSRCSRFASATVEDSGLPPNVEIELALSESTISWRPSTAPMAMPLPRPLAMTMASGWTSYPSIPQYVSPVRPNPVWTSSEMNGIPNSSRMPFTIPKYSGGGVTNPPTPWMGSEIIAATSPEVAVPQRDDLVRPAVGRGEQQRGLHGLGSRAHEERLDRRFDGSLRGELLGKLDHRPDQVQRRGVRDLAGLLAQRVDDLLHGVPRDRRDDPAEEVQVLLAGGIPHPGALAADQLDGLLVVERDPVGDDLPVPLQQVRGVVRELRGGHGSSSVSSPYSSGRRSRRNCQVLRTFRLTS